MAASSSAHLHVTSSSGALTTTRKPSRRPPSFADGWVHDGIRGARVRPVRPGRTTQHGLDSVGDMRADVRGIVCCDGSAPDLLAHVGSLDPERRPDIGPGPWFYVTEAGRRASDEWAPELGAGPPLGQRTTGGIVGRYRAPRQPNECDAVGGGSVVRLTVRTSLAVAIAVVCAFAGLLLANILHPPRGGSRPCWPESGTAACTYPGNQFRWDLTWTLAGLVLGVVLAIVLFRVIGDSRAQGGSKSRALGH